LANHATRKALRFSIYTPLFGKPIQTIAELEKKLLALKKAIGHPDIPTSEYYSGFRLHPQCIYFYTLGTTTFSISLQYTRNRLNHTWSNQLLSP